MTHPVSIDKYQIVEHLGSGSFGDVYRVHDRALKAEKAIKVVGATDPAKFLSNLQEAQILNKCRHKHIVVINEANIFPVNGTRRVVLDLEYIAEGSLESALCSRWISIKDAVNCIRGALLGLEHAHAQGFLHRDIKPGNILISNAGAKLSDFGLATNAAVDLIGSAQGYTTHLPPEYFTDSQTTVSSDVFATGITFFRAVSNIADWCGVTRSIPLIRLKIEKGKFIDAIGFAEFIPGAVRKIISKACAVDASKRFQCAKEMRQKLDSLRFSIDWISIGSHKWEGRLGSTVYTAEVIPTSNEVNFKKNGRKVSAKCMKFPSLSAAISALHNEVASTTLQ